MRAAVLLSQLNSGFADPALTDARSEVLGFGHDETGADEPRVAERPGSVNSMQKCQVLTRLSSSLNLRSPALFPLQGFVLRPVARGGDSSRGDLSLCHAFAHSIDGYAEAGSFESCADPANNQAARTLTELRCALFFEARRDSRSGGMSDVEPAVRDLLRAIRTKVANKELT
jgi:hypothetical protein